MAANLAWTLFQMETLKEMDNASSVDECKNILASVIGCEDWEHDLRVGGLNDVFYNTWSFAKSEGLSMEKISTILAILKDTHDTSMRSLWVGDQSFAHFKKRLLEHSVQRPPYSVGIFGLQDVKAVTDFILDTYYRHYRLLKYCFVSRHLMDVTAEQSFVELPPLFPPLGEAIPETEWFKKVEEEKEVGDTDVDALTNDDGEKSTKSDADTLSVPDLEGLPVEVKNSLTNAMEALRLDFEAQMEKREAVLKEKIATLEASVK